MTSVESLLTTPIALVTTRLLPSTNTIWWLALEMFVKNFTTWLTANSKTNSRTIRKPLVNTKFYLTRNADSRVNWKSFLSTLQKSKITTPKSVKRLTKTFKDWRSRSTSLMLRLNSTFSTWIAVWRELNLAMTVSTDRSSASLRSRSPPSKNRLRLKELYSTPLRLISPPSVNNFSICLVLVTSWEKERLRNSTKSSRTSRMKATWLWNKFKLSPTQLIWTRRTASARRPKRTTRQSSNRKH